MSALIRILLVSLGIGALAVPFFAAPRGWGVGTEKNTKIVLANKDCTDQQKDKNGNCPVNQNFRSRYSRSFLGGGTGTGK
jgi:hypothetical protein